MTGDSTANGGSKPNNSDGPGGKSNARGNGKFNGHDELGGAAIEPDAGDPDGGSPAGSFAEPHKAEAPYPLDALPQAMREAVTEYRAFGQQPLSLIAGSALAAVSLAAQGRADVVRVRGWLSGPISLYLMTIAVSGERKTAADEIFAGPIRAWMQERSSLQDEERRSARAARAIWEADHKAILGQLAAGRGKGAPVTTEARTAAEADERELARQLRELGEAPEPPAEPALFCEDATPEGLVLKAAKGWPSLALATDEAGLVVGGRGMRDESGIAFIATLSKFWGGQEYRRDRAGDGASLVRGRRLTVNLMMQPVMFERLLAYQGNSVRSMGLLSRFLMGWPASTMGGRGLVYPEGSPKLGVFGARLCELLDAPLPIASGNMELAPPALPLTPAAQEIWGEHYKTIERELGALGPYAEIQDIASKNAEQAARLAGVFHVFERGPGGAIDASTMAAAVSLARWYLDEAGRVLEAFETAREVRDADLLLEWLQRRKVLSFHAREILRFGPAPFRNVKRRDAALDLLLQDGTVQAVPGVRGARFVLNPYAHDA